ncbi:MAG: hypothetical protein ACKOEC_13925 [Acidimicrobiia bacterium]
MIPIRAASLAIATGVLAAGSAPLAQTAPPLELFLKAASTDDRVARAAMDQIASQWRNAYTPMIIDMARQLRPASPLRYQRLALPLEQADVR